MFIFKKILISDTINEIEKIEDNERIYYSMCKYNKNLIISDNLDKRIKNIEKTIKNKVYINELGYYSDDEINYKSDKKLNIISGKENRSILIYGDNKYICLGKVTNKEEFDLEYPNFDKNYENIRKKNQDTYEINDFKIKLYKYNGTEQAVIYQGKNVKFISTTYILFDELFNLQKINLKYF